MLALRSTVGQLPLEQHIGVRIPEGQPVKLFIINNIRKNTHDNPSLLIARVLGFTAETLRYSVSSSEQGIELPCSLIRY
jgi:hypothetical protein